MNHVLEFERPLVELEKRIAELRGFAADKNIDLSEEVERLEKRAEALRKEIFGNLTPWQRVQIVRHPGRPTALDYIGMIFEDFLELKGDRLHRDDPAIVGGIARLDGRPVTVIGTQKGKDTKENLARNFGMPHPEGYRKALRLMKQAEKFGRPVVTLVDVVGAYPGVEAEERGQGEAIARNIVEMSRLAVPIVVVITGEGGSGGALAIGVGDRLFMLENAYFSVISPEGCATILWKEASRAPEAAAALKMGAKDLAGFGIVDKVIPEPMGAAHKDPERCAALIKEALVEALASLTRMNPKRLVAQRYTRLRRIGSIVDEALRTTVASADGAEWSGGEPAVEQGGKDQDQPEG